MASFSSQSSFRGQVLDEQDAEDKFSCGICCNLMENPCRPDVCQHLFCKECLYNSSIQSNQCPMCRKCFSFSKVVFDKQIENEMSNAAVKCEYCRQIVKVRNLANHRIKCNEYVTPKKSQNGSFSSTSSASATSWDSGNGSLSNPPRQSAVSQVRSMVSNIVASHSSRPAAPNRYTFRCPYCHADNLTLDSLRDHCNQYHVDGEKEMVCPVCTAMPWGDPNYKSIDFITHLNLRHKFEYDKYVDFSLEDEDALSEALRNSLLVQ